MAETTVNITQGTGTQIDGFTTAGGQIRQAVVIGDPSTNAAAASIQQFHNSDNTNPGATAYGILTGGVAQLLNQTGSLDRQRETSFDNLPGVGISTGSAQLASLVTITLGQLVTLNAAAQAVTVSALSGTNRGAPWTIQVGSMLSVDTGANQEYVYVTAVNTGLTKVTGIFLKNHSNGVVVTTNVYNQAKDATTPDGSNGAGFQAGATYFFNPNLNSGAGGWEAARSSLGAEDNVSGAGIPPATEYEFNGLGYDRGRSLQAKGYNTKVISSGGGIGSTSITLASAPTGLQPGSPIYLLGGNQEYVYTALSYTAGANPVVLQSAITQASHVSVGYEVFSPSGPALAGFLPTGVGIEEEAVYDPVSGLYYIERAATQDAQSGQNIAMESLAVYNGTTFDRATGSATTGLDTNLKTLLAGEDLTINVMKVEQRFSYASYSTAQTATVIKSGAGFLHTVTILGGTLGAITLWDNTAGSGTTIFPAFTPTATLPCPSIIVDASFANGLTLTTAAATVILLTYR